MKLFPSLLTPPVLEGQDKTQTATLLLFVLVASFGINLLAILLGGALSPDYYRAALGEHIVILLLQIGMFRLIGRGQIRLAAFVGITFAWCIISLAAYTNDGIFNPILRGHILIVIIAGLLIDEWAALTVTIVSSIFGLYLVQVANARLYIGEVGGINVHLAWLVHAIILIVSGMSLYFGLRAVRASRKKAAENALALRASEARYRELFDANPHPMYVMDTQTLNFLAVNDAMIEKYGYTREEFLHMTGKDLRPLEDVSTFLDKVKEFSQTESHDVDVGVWRHRKKDRTVIFVEAAAHTLNYFGRPALVATAYDLTKRIQSEEAVRRSEELFATIFQSVPSAIEISTIQESRILNVNRNFLELTGFEASEVISRPVSEVGIWSPLSQRADLLQELHEKGVLRAKEAQWKTKSGAMVDILISIVPIDIGGEACILAIALDVTELLQSAEALRWSENLFTRVFQTVPTGIIISTFDEGVVLRVNDYFLTLVEYDRAEIINQSSERLWIDWKQHESLVESTRNKGGFYGLETQLRAKSGAIIDVIMSTETIELNNQICFVWIVVDIRERKRAEQDRLEAERARMEIYKEREVLELKERFISKMSHEFRTPLAVILSSKETLEHYYDRMTSDQRVEKLHNIEVQTRYITDLLDDVLLLSKAHAGKMQFRPVLIDIATFCKHWFEQIQLTDQKPHQYVFSANSDLGVVQSDEHLLQHMLVNLLSNAFKYSPEGGEVKLGLSRLEDDMLIQISDQGIGIPEEDQKHLFEPFYRASNTGRIKGTGLGLAIVKESVETHGGTIACESVTGKGTTFIIRLPIDSKLTTRELKSE